MLHLQNESSLLRSVGGNRVCRPHLWPCSWPQVYSAFLSWPLTPGHADSQPRGSDMLTSEVNFWPSSSLKVKHFVSSEWTTSAPPVWQRYVLCWILSTFHWFFLLSLSILPAALSARTTRAGSRHEKRKKGKAIKGLEFLTVTPQAHLSTHFSAVTLCCTPFTSSSRNW